MSLTTNPELPYPALTLLLFLAEPPPQVSELINSITAQATSYHRSTLYFYCIIWTYFHA